MKIVCILPLRDWNPPNRCFEFVGFHPFVSYLWGIETYSPRFPKLSSEPFVSYLWGIETAIGRSKAHTWRGFVSYLWGIETHLCWHCKWTQALVCVLPLRDWNCSIVSFSFLSGGVCILPLRDWNRIQRNEIILKETVCILPLRNWTWHVGRDRAARGGVFI